jgi:hypothetical protein
VLYLPDNPRQDAIIDRGIWWNWATPGIAFLSAALLGLMMIGMLRKNAPQKN